MRKSWLSVFATFLLMCPVAFSGETLIRQLRLDGDANGALANFTNINGVTAQTVTAQVVSSQTVIWSGVRK